MSDTEMKEKVMVWEYFGFSGEGFFVEVGANDPKDLSQTWLLEKKGWRGILIEPLPELASRLEEKRPGSKIHPVAVSAPEKVGKASFYVYGALSSLNSDLRTESPDEEKPERVIQVDVVTLDPVLESEKVGKSISCRSTRRGPNWMS